LGSLLELIKEELRTREFLPFDKFVELCLYHPEHGYYTSRRVSPYPGEDFFTAPELSPIFGKVLANYLKEKAKELSIKPNLVEVGAGKGFLLKELSGELSPKRLIAVEKRERPRWIPKRVEWLKELKELEPLEGVFVANELFDAFPFKRIVKREGALFEVVVTLKDGSLREELRPFEGELQCEPGPEGEYPLFVGWEEFVRELSLKLKRGLFVTFDYGGECREIKDKRNFRAFKRGRLVEDYLEHPGETDLTASVDFTRLKELFEENQFKLLDYQPLSKFLLDWGIEKFAGKSSLPSVLTLLVDMGRKFRLLSFYKG